MAIASFCDHCGAENALGETICHACQHPLAQPFTSETANSLLNERYAILHEIGAGGFGAVYLARDTRESERLVAVKQINLQGLSSQEIIEATDAFNREAEILSTLSHPLLPTIFDRFSDPEHWYLVMTYIDGSTLDEHLQQQRVKALPASAGLPLGETLEIALRLCDGLHYLHAQQPPVIFRDLKPGNIMRTRKGQLYLIDFGIARRFKPGQAKDTIPFGSPGFAAPEQYGRAQTTPQADIYSLGALLYCLLTGDDPSEHPFAFPSLHQHGKDGISEINALIQSMVALEPGKRPVDIHEVQTELQRIQQINLKASQQGRIWIPPQSQTPPVGSGQQHILLKQTNTPQKPRKTTRRAVLITSLVLGGVAAIGGMAVLSNQSQPSGVSQVDPDQATATTTNLTPAVPLNGPTFWSPDMSYAAVVNVSLQQIEIYQVQGQQPTQTIKFPAAFTNPTIWWSPDDSNILAQADSKAIYAWNTIDGQLLFSKPTETSSSRVTSASWSPDGQNCTISYGYNGNAVFTILRASDGFTLFQKSLPNPDNLLISNIAWSPDNQYFALPDAATWPGGYSWSMGIWDRGTYQRVNSITVTAPIDTSETYSIGSITWSSEEQKLAAIVYDTIYIIHLGSQQSIYPLEAQFGAEYATNSFFWSFDGRYIAALIQQNLSVWSTVTYGQQISLNGNNYPPQTNNIVAFSWSTDSQSLLVADSDNNLWQWAIDNY